MIIVFCYILIVYRLGINVNFTNWVIDRIALLTEGYYVNIVLFFVC